MVQSIESVSAKTKSQPHKPSGPTPGSQRSPGQDGRSNHVHTLLILVSAPLVQKGIGRSQNALTLVPKLDVWNEIDDIVAACHEQQVDVAVKIEVRYATYKEIIRLNSFYRPLIIHYIGHGIQIDETTALLLEDEDGLAVPMTVEEFKQALGHGARPCQLAFFNACYSQSLAQLFADHAQVPHVVGIYKDNEVDDSAALIFARELYPAVLKGATVNNAFLAGYKAVRADSKLAEKNSSIVNEPANYKESKNFCLLPQGSHDRKLNLYRSQGEVEAPRWGLTNLYTAGYSLFIGRQKELYEIVYALHHDSSRCVLIHGFGGIGKTVLAEAAGFWAHHRKRYSDGVWMIELRGVQKASDARVRIANQIAGRGNPLNLPVETAKSNYTLAEFFLEKEVLLILDDLDDLLPEGNNADEVLSFHENDNNADEVLGFRDNNDVNEISDLINSFLRCRKVKVIITSRRTLPNTVISYRYDTPKMTAEATQKVFEAYAFSDAQSDRPHTDYETFDRILTFLDGYPFAIRLAASYIKQTYCDLGELWKQLSSDPLNTLQDPNRIYGQSRDTSLRITLSISYKVLSPSAQQMFQWLACYPSGLSQVIAKIIFGDTSLVGLRELVSFSMAEQREDSFHKARFSLPEPARSFAEFQQEKDQIESISIKSLKYYIAFVEDNVDMIFLPDIQSSAEQKILLEQPNIRRFLQWGYEHESNHGICYSARITALLTDYQLQASVGTLEETLQSYPKAKEAAVRCNDLIAEALIDKGVGDLLSNFPQDLPSKTENARQQYEDALRKLEEALETSKEIMERARICLSLGNIHASLGQSPLALQRYGEAKSFLESLLVHPETNNLISLFSESIEGMLDSLEQTSVDKEIEKDDESNSNVSKVLKRLEILIRKERTKSGRSAG